MQIQWFRTDQRKFFKVIRIPIINKLKTSSLIIKENQIFVEEKIGKKSSQWSLKKFWFLVISFFFTTTSIFSLFYIFKKNKNQLIKKSKLKKEEDNFNENSLNKMLESKINFIELTKSEINQESFNKSNIKSYNNQVFYSN